MSTVFPLIHICADHNISTYVCILKEVLPCRHNSEECICSTHYARISGGSIWSSHFRAVPSTPYAFVICKRVSHRLKSHFPKTLLRIEGTAIIRIALEELHKTIVIETVVSLLSKFFPFCDNSIEISLAGSIIRTRHFSVHLEAVASSLEKHSHHEGMSSTFGWSLRRKTCTRLQMRLCKSKIIDNSIIDFLSWFTRLEGIFITT